MTIVVALDCREDWGTSATQKARFFIPISMESIRVLPTVFVLGGSGILDESSSLANRDVNTSFVPVVAAPIRCSRLCSDLTVMPRAEVTNEKTLVGVTMAMVTILTRMH